MTCVRVALLITCSVGLALGVGGLASAAERPHAARALFRDTAFESAPRALRVQPSPTAGTSGGTYTAASGDTVQIYAANQYVAGDPSFGQRWADFLASAPHRDELSQLTLVFLPLAHVQSFCGAQALACYWGNTIVTPGEDPAPELPAASILLHEYGHHIAYHRNNDPWPAVDWGAKRWASHENICRQTADGSLHPGDEDANYALNPGEAWAETYRVVAEGALGLPSTAWEIVSRSFYPDEAALTAVSEDVLEPWAENTRTTVAGSLRRTQRQRRLRIDTPYDGKFAVTFANRTRTPVKLQLMDASGATVGTSTVANGRTRTLAAEICGQRSLVLRASRTATAAGSYSVTVSRP